MYTLVNVTGLCTCTCIRFCRSPSGLWSAATSPTTLWGLSLGLWIECWFFKLGSYLRWYPKTSTWKPGFLPFSQNKFPGLFQDSDWFFPDSKIHINPYTPKISMLILLTVCHTFQIFHLSLTNFQHFPGPVVLFQDFPDLENARVKFQDFPGPARTLENKLCWCFKHSVWLANTFRKISDTKSHYLFNNSL